MKNLGMVWFFCLSLIVLAVALGTIEKRNDKIKRLEEQRDALLERTTGIHYEAGEKIGVTCSLDGSIRVSREPSQ
jgi:predicted nuclease with RNAse H fold